MALNHVAEPAQIQLIHSDSLTANNFGLTLHDRPKLALSADCNLHMDFGFTLQGEAKLRCSSQTVGSMCFGGLSWRTQPCLETFNPIGFFVVSL
ncbi:hypothetical protein B9Q06_09405 [Candidatus Marsarchaeota G2 archaeon ECH_B_2]|uniref:Uncharacterized protein n=3 Tax=Candidatus Marsarchaeota group 2 TaxID=2203771 RepID=A0A2R6B6Z3_9ARCH|nr:MAG: hypothetical protein B9Q06_09405 [Candidatus Marsarchaeota G2 archaeon ECH_B_2]PSN98493.1 MAG: hypothetical protein B9Q07_09515 [Candidatus Marsarchaeota G2 archaeon ECH_B_3]PSO01522.1 MAG: hypothetical protein B9Q05_08765 [Candidatus Marsarchaeota G2 archaeon ECH_B_1]